MVRSDMGYWVLSMPFKRGKYRYYFLDDNRKVLDPEHDNIDILKKIGQVSYFIVN